MKKIKGDQYLIEYDENGAVFTGILRLDSTDEYTKKFMPIMTKIKSKSDSDSYSLDFRGVSFMNSAGISTISRLFIAARASKINLTVYGDVGIAWHSRSLPSLAALGKNINISLS